MPSRRVEQVAGLLRTELSDIVRREVHDPRVGFITITAVDVSPDLKNARVFVSCLGSDEEQRASLRALRRATGFLRTALGGRLRMRAVPQLDFKLDSSMAEAEEVQRVLLQLAPELESAARRESAQADAVPDGPSRPGEHVPAAPR